MRILIALASLVLLAGAAIAAEPPPAASPEAVQRALAAQDALFARAPAATAADANKAWAFSFDGLMTDRVPMTAFRGQAVLVVNTASRCGFTPQYAGLQRIYARYQARGFTIVGVPSNDFMGQEPGSAAEIAQLCRMNYGVTFPMADKVKVTGTQAHPFYRWASRSFGDAAVPRWNFHKILIGRDGRVIGAFESAVTPESPQLTGAIERALAARS